MAGSAARGAVEDRASSEDAKREKKTTFSLFFVTDTDTAICRYGKGDSRALASCIE
jgi:hypothetical protein